MLLYLLRHADADTEASSDDERFLSEKGIMQAQRMARFCEAHDMKPDRIFTSPLRRAHQTATCFADVLRAELQTVRWLSSGAQPPALLSQIKDYSNLHSIMLVGHEPDFSQFSAYLTGARSGANVRIRKGSLTLFTILDFVPGGARMEFSIPAKLV